MIQVVLPYPPSVNHYWERGQRGSLYISEAGQAFKAEVAALCYQVDPTNGLVSLKIDQYRPRKIGDIDNNLKPLLDAMQSYLFNNDNQVQELHIRRHDNRNLFPQGAMMVEMTILDTTSLEPLIELDKEHNNVF